MSTIADLIIAFDTASDDRQGLQLSAEHVALITGNTSLLDDLRAIQNGSLPNTLTIDDICNDMQVTRETIRRWRRLGKFVKPIVEGHRLVRFDREEYVRWKLGRHAA